VFGALPFDFSSTDEIDVITDFHNGIHIVTDHNSCGSKVVSYGANEIVNNDRSLGI